MTLVVVERLLLLLFRDGYEYRVLLHVDVHVLTRRVVQVQYCTVYNSTDERERLYSCNRYKIRKNGCYYVVCDPCGGWAVIVIIYSE